jgi:hypothetical protein
MKDLSINKSGIIVYKNIETNLTCENIFNIFSDDENIDLRKILNDEVKRDLREIKINKILSIQSHKRQYFLYIQI